MIRRLIFLVVFGIGVVFGYRAHDYLATRGSRNLR